MHPALLLIAALLIPVIITIILFTPTYLAMLGAIYMKYGDTALPMKFQIFTVIETYMQLFNYWLENYSILGFMEYTFPIAIIPCIGILLTFFLAWKFTMYVRNIFVLTS